ncbi:hypothetical protein BTL55_15000 [Bordetella trematum]|nr:hypothetical protein BTL55_15000 [Bordetella trematum]
MLSQQEYLCRHNDAVQHLINRPGTIQDCRSGPIVPLYNQVIVIVAIADLVYEHAMMSQLMNKEFGSINRLPSS